MFERFSPRARHVVVLSQQQSRDLGHAHLGTEHLLLGLLSTGWSAAASATATVLVTAGVEPSAARARVATLTSVESAPTEQGPEVTRPFGEHVPFTDTVRRTFELAVRHTLQWGHDTVDPGHLVLGLLDQPDNNALRTLSGLDIATPALREQVIDTLTSSPLIATDPRIAPTTAARTEVPASPASRPTPERTPGSPSRESAAFAAAMAPPSTPVEPAIMTWLQDTLYGRHVRPEYLGVLNMLAMAGGDQRVPPPPDEVLVSWHRELARLRTTRLQSELGFLDATARAEWPEASIAQALAIPEGATVAEHRARLEAERDYYHPSRHSLPWTG